MNVRRGEQTPGNYPRRLHPPGVEELGDRILGHWDIRVLYRYCEEGQIDSDKTDFVNRAPKCSHHAVVTSVSKEPSHSDSQAQAHLRSTRLSKPPRCI